MWGRGTTQPGQHPGFLALGELRALLLLKLQHSQMAILEAPARYSQHGPRNKTLALLPDTNPHQPDLISLTFGFYLSTWNRTASCLTRRSASPSNNTSRNTPRRSRSRTHPPRRLLSLPNGRSVPSEPGTQFKRSKRRAPPPPPRRHHSSRFLLNDIYSAYPQYLDPDGFLLDKKIGVGCPKRMTNCKVLVANTPMDTDKVQLQKYSGRASCMSD